MGIEKKPIYCPEKIQCHRSPTETQCDLDSEIVKYFDLLIETPADGCIDTANFTNAHGAFHSHTPGITCEYRPAHPGSCSYIRLQSKTEANLEAYYEKSSLWTYSTKLASCLTSKPVNCPITESIGFIIHNVNITSGIYVSVNGVEIAQPLITPATYVNITFDDLIANCSSEKSCNIDITTLNNGKYGYMVVDMDSMKILQAISLYPEKIQMNVSKPSYNLIDVYYPSSSLVFRNHNKNT